MDRRDLLRNLGLASIGAALGLTAKSELDEPAEDERPLEIVVRGAFVGQGRTPYDPCPIVPSHLQGNQLSILRQQTGLPPLEYPHFEAIKPTRMHDEQWLRLLVNQLRHDLLVRGNAYIRISNDT